MSNIPVIIPLGCGSTHHNDELRFLLRSLERNAIGLGTIYIATIYKPSWLKESDGLVVVPIKDIYKDNKDANLFEKTLRTIEKHNIGDFVFTADDAAFLKPIELCSIPVIHNHRPNSLFYCDKPSKWQRRVMNTLEWAKGMGVELPHNLECHCPQLFDGRKLLEGMKDVDYVSQPGLVIYTTWRVVTGSWQESDRQAGWKWTFETPMDESVTTMAEGELVSRAFIGYNEACSTRVLARLGRMFPTPSRYER